MPRLDRFVDRADAGRRLGSALGDLARREPVVLGLPRGGVVVAAEVADVLRATLDVLVVRKVPAPGRPELAMAAVGEDGAWSVNADVVAACGVGPAELESAAARAADLLKARASSLRAGRAPAPLHGRLALVVDDGLATGATATAACRLAHARGADEVVLAVPVAAPDAVARLEEVASRVVALRSPRGLHAVGEAYEDFREVGDEEVLALLAGRR